MNNTETIGYSQAKNYETQPYIIPYLKVNLKSFIHLNVGAKTIKLIDINIA